MIKLLIFDWDDVLTLGSKEGYFKCYHAILDELGLYLDPREERKRIMARWSQTYQSEVAELLKDYPELIEKGCEIFLKHLFGDTFVSSLSLVPGTKELLVRLHKKYILTLATGVHPKLLRKRIMPTFAIPNVFSHIITSQDLPDSSKAKPDPYIAQELMRLTNVSPEQTVMVGDAKNDVLMARNAGITPIVVLTGHLTRKEAEDMEVKYIVDDVTEIEKILEPLQ
jgi:phosphoglycolate phosphatase-like HAD superfamily hydrolase